MGTAVRRIVIIVVVVAALTVAASFMFQQANSVEFSADEQDRPEPGSIEHVVFQTLPSGGTSTALPLRFVCYPEPRQDADSLSIEITVSDGSSIDVPVRSGTSYRAEQTFETIGNYTARCEVMQNGSSYTSEELSFEVIEPPPSPFGNLTE